MKLNRVVAISLLTSTLLLSADVPDFFSYDKDKDTPKQEIAEDKTIKSNNANFVTQRDSNRLEDRLESSSENEFDTSSAETALLSKLKDKKKFNLETKQLFVDKKVKFVEIKIPIHQISEILTDKEIVKLDFIDNKNLEISLDQAEAKKIILVNKDLNLDQNVKVTFIDGSSVNFLLNLGNSIQERHIEYKLYFEKKKIALLPEFQKRLKVKNIHSYFNNVATKLLIDKITQSNDFVNIEENKKRINKPLFEGVAEIQTLYGKLKQNYKLNLDFVYETPYVEDTKKLNIKKRLVMLEMTITNNENDAVLIITPEFLKKRFGNFVAMYMGDLDTKQNHVSPKDSLKILVVIEDFINESDLK